MDWFSNNWFWLAIFAFFIWIHFSGHGGHGGCGGHDHDMNGHSNKEDQPHHDEENHKGHH